MKREKATVLSRLLTMPGLPTVSETESAETIQGLVASYLAHNGYVASARGFAKDVDEEEKAFRKVSGNGAMNGSPRGLGRLEEGEEKEVSRRQRISVALGANEEIRRAILTGDIDRAISLTQTFYPTVLDKNEPIYFRLRARKFVEMMRMCADGASPPTKQIESEDRMAIDDESQEDEEDDEVHMTDVTLTQPPSTKFVIDEEDSEDEGDVDEDGVDDHDLANAKQQRREATLLAEALAYGQQLQEDYRDDPREEVKRVLQESFSLLAYTDPRGSVVGHLLEESGRREVAEDLNSAILGLFPGMHLMKSPWERVQWLHWKW
jgi:Ran-binding protein 9/10